MVRLGEGEFSQEDEEQIRRDNAAVTISQRAIGDSTRRTN
jgi:hypothetical protein